jgi:uncharacterized membrane-anchored protein YhcB (DUF1043 family)
MFDFENMSIEDLQKAANGLIAVVVLIGLAIVIVGVIAIRMTKRDTRRHEDVIALMTEIRNRLDQLKP